jgi:hypothetical protein
MVKSGMSRDTKLFVIAEQVSLQSPHGQHQAILLEEVLEEVMGEV